MPMGCRGWVMLYLILGDEQLAEYWMDRAAIIDPDGYFVTRARMALFLFLGDREKAQAMAKKGIAGYPAQSTHSYRVLRDVEIAAGRWNEARDIYKPHYGDLLTRSKPEIDYNNYELAVDLVSTLRGGGETGRAARLSESILDFFNSGFIQRLGQNGFEINDARVYALQGKRDLALNAIRDAIDMGWRGQWWYYLDQDLALESLRDEPQFQAMMYEVRDDLAAQLIRLRAIDADGKTLVTN